MASAPKKSAIPVKKPGRVELEPPSRAWISWCILLAYIATFFEGARPLRARKEAILVYRIYSYS